VKFYPGFVMTIAAGGQNYSITGTSKRQAKERAVAAALAGLRGTSSLRGQ